MIEKSSLFLILREKSIYMSIFSEYRESKLLIIFLLLYLVYIGYEIVSLFVIGDSAAYEYAMEAFVISLIVFTICAIICFFNDKSHWIWFVGLAFWLAPIINAISGYELETLCKIAYIVFGAVIMPIGAFVFFSKD